MDYNRSLFHNVEVLLGVNVKTSRCRTKLFGKRGMKQHIKITKTFTFIFRFNQMESSKIKTISALDTSVVLSSRLCVRFPSLLQEGWRKILKAMTWSCQTNTSNVTMHSLGKAIWRHIWTVEKNQINAACVIMHPLMQALWGNIWKGTVEKSQMNANSVIMHPLIQVHCGNIWRDTVEKSRINATGVILHQL